MKLTLIDKNLIETLRTKPEGMLLSEIGRKLSMDLGNLSRKLRKLEIHNLVKRISGSGLYKFNISQSQDYNFFIVECPKCGERKEIFSDVMETRCSNPHCVSSSGNRTRYWITNKRIKKIRHIIRDKDY